METVTAELVYHNYAKLGEGSLWDRQSERTRIVEPYRRLEFGHTYKSPGRKSRGISIHLACWSMQSLKGVR